MNNRNYSAAPIANRELTIFFATKKEAIDYVDTQEEESIVWCNNGEEHEEWHYYNFSTCNESTWN